MDNQQGNSHILEECFESVAYTIGALMGDGQIKKYSLSNGAIDYNVNIRCMDLDIICKVCSEINNYFGKDIRPHEYKNPNGTLMFRASFGNEFTYEFFNYFISVKALLPQEVFVSSRKAKTSFIAGLFDTDGWIAETKRPQAKYGVGWKIGYAARFPTLVEDVSRLLMKSGVKVGGIRKEVSGYGTTMYKIYPNIRSFIDSGFYFFTSRKAERIERYKLFVCPQSYVEPSETIMSSP
uniref:Putative homing endonuclease n=1 Tax=viral metagenome TaxID=1070528 RepID=A0A6M3JTH2_9ZZZZ